MSDSKDHEPDPAALDELLRAFGEGSEAPIAPVPVIVPLEGDDEAAADARPAADEQTGADNEAAADEEPAADDDPGDEDASGEPAEILIVEQEPLVAPADPTPTPPKIIRIDDFSGSVVVDDVPEPPPPVVPPIDPMLRRPDDSADPADPADSADSSDTGDAGGGASGDREGEAGDGPVVISIEDEDLPDPVYVQGDLEGSGDRTIVFIEDDDTGDTVSPDVERDVRRGIEPRLRERRAAVKRAIGRKRLRWVLSVAVIVVIAVGTLALLGSGLFAIKADNVEVFGAVYADQERVDAVVDELVGTPALRADTQAAEEALESIPWVDEARVRVSFPNSAVIEIREREAWTTYQGPDQRYRVLDRDGRVLAVLDGYPIAYLLLDGPDPVDLDAGDFAPQGYAAASELAKNLTGSVRGQVAFVSVTADGSSLSLFLDDGTEVRFGAARDLFNKLLRLETTLANNPEREPGVIDVSTSEVTL